MKRLLLPLLAALALPIAVNANWFGIYGSNHEAWEACYEFIDQLEGWDDCIADKPTNQILAVDGDHKVLKRFKY